MKLIRWLVPAFLLLAGMATPQDIRYNYDKSADFSKYKTYKWVEIKGADQPDGARRRTAPSSAAIALNLQQDFIREIIQRSFQIASGNVL